MSLSIILPPPPPLHHNLVRVHRECKFIIQTIFISVVKARELRTQDLDKAANTRIEVYHISIMYTYLETF